MDDDKKNLPFLVMDEHHLSLMKARQAVIDMLLHFRVDRPKHGWDNSTITTNHGEKATSVAFADLVREARRTGTLGRFQRLLDAKDNVFGGSYMDEFATPNHNMKLKSELAGLTFETDGPGRMSSVQIDLTDDILYYRALACKHSSEYGFKLTSRYFRNYLSACISLADAFINRHIVIAKHDGFSSPEFEELQVTTKTDKRFDLWWRFCCNNDPSPLFKSKHWCHFQELRAKRNEIVHSLAPISVYSMPEIQKYLNLVRSGIGELLLLMRKAHQKPTLGFIERLRTAPMVAYHKIHLHKDGDHCILIKRD